MAGDDLMERVETLEEHVAGQSKNNPGLLMRMDRMEWILKLLIAVAGLYAVGNVAELLKVLTPGPP